VESSKVGFEMCQAELQPSSPSLLSSLHQSLYPPPAASHLSRCHSRPPELIIDSYLSPKFWNTFSIQLPRWLTHYLYYSQSGNATPCQAPLSESVISSESLVLNSIDNFKSYGEDVKKSSDAESQVSWLFERSKTCDTFDKGMRHRCWGRDRGAGT
jgi:hypothetical protein